MKRSKFYSYYFFSGKMQSEKLLILAAVGAGLYYYFKEDESEPLPMSPIIRDIEIDGKKVSVFKKDDRINVYEDRKEAEMHAGSIPFVPRNGTYVELNGSKYGFPYHERFYLFNFKENGAAATGTDLQKYGGGQASPASTTKIVNGPVNQNNKNDDKQEPVTPSEAGGN